MLTIPSSITAATTRDRIFFIGTHSFFIFFMRVLRIETKSKSVWILSYIWLNVYHFTQERMKMNNQKTKT